MPEKEEKIVPEEESDFADAASEEPVIEEPEVPEPVEGPAPEEKPEEPAKEEKPAKEEPKTYVYDDPNLENIEASRKAFSKLYKGMSKWSLIPTALLIVGIVLAWVLPSYVFPDNSGLALGITLGVLAVLIIGMLVLSYFRRKKTNATLKDYLNKFYVYSNEYVFSGTGVSGIEGDIDSKLSKVEFEEAGLYKDVYSVGSRASLTFNYYGKKCGIADAAGQVRGKKALETVFVGKMFRAPNTYKGSTLTIYLKGNDRALPPTAIDDIPVIEEDKSMVVRGEAGAKKAWNKKIKDAVKAFRTDDTLVDMTIRIEEGKTFVLLGYEDNLMVLPMEHAFNPEPTKHYREDFKKLLALVDAIDGIKGGKGSEKAEEEPKPEPVAEAPAEEPKAAE